jgi:acetolactate synthase I/II/III large subunit
MIRLSDYVFRTLADWGVRHIFMVTGGGAMYLNDSIGREHRIHFICNHHEQAAAMAAEGYARVSGKIGVVNVTTGPGGINALNGVFGAWTDSIPMLVISGQVKRETCMATYGLTTLRQLGDQEVDIISMVKGIAKYAQLIQEPDSIRYHLERAYHLAVTGRPGPCWLDIPVDVQSALVDEDSLPAYDPKEDPPGWSAEKIPTCCKEVLERLRGARRPVVLAGTGVRLANALPEFEEVIRRLQIPVTTAWTHDIIASDDELFCGRPGTIGDRAGNFSVQNADVLLILGSRLNIRQVSYNWQSFAKNTFKIQVDVDAAELNKPTVRPDLAIHCDLKAFLNGLLLEMADSCSSADHAPWLAWCRERVRRYPVVQERQRNSLRLNPYHFVERLFDALAPNDVVVCGNASACIVPFQVARIKKGQRLISNSGAASMGHDLPAALGGAIARGGKRVICLAGDGSIQLNIQEFQTIAHHRLPVKIFVLSNGGYLSIRATQANFFQRFVGESPASGVSFPDISKVAEAYGIPAMVIKNSTSLDSLPAFIQAPGPALCEVRLDPDQEFEPRLSSRQNPDGTISTSALEDMYPFLDADELKANMMGENR